jgi:hypothetical protein
MTEQTALSKRNRHLVQATENYFVQYVKTGRIATPRWQFLVDESVGKTVLHLGCVDSPIFNPQANLHIFINQVAAQLDGLDTAEDGLVRLREYVSGGLYSDIRDVQSNHYDLVLVPEVIEHVDNIGEFLKALDTLSFDELLLTAPSWNLANDAYKEVLFKDIDDGYFSEFIHPDHRAWFTPYTLLKNIDAHTSWRVTSLDFIELSVMARCTRA